MVSGWNAAVSDLQRTAPRGRSRGGDPSPAPSCDLRAREAGLARLRPDAVPVLMESPAEPVKPLMEPGFDVVTGAFSFTGRAIAQRLLSEERRVRTLTNHPQRPGSEEIKVDVAPLQFADRAALVDSLRGADVLYNTYWVRFRHGKLSFGDAIANTRILVGAAAEAGVRKIVHISVSNPSIESHLDYYAGKARTEEIVRTSGLRWAIVRPTLVFGPGDILLNNIAWLLRRMPVFAIPGMGTYRVQPVAIAVGRRPRFMYMPPRLTLLAGDIVGAYVHDVILTRQELQGLMEELLVSHEKPRGTRRIDNWLLTNADTLGRNYASELARHWR